MERTRTLRVAGALAFCLVCALALSFHASRPAVDVLSLLPGREFVLARSSRPRLAPFAVFVHGTRRCSWLSESIINTGSVEDDILDELERVVAEHVALHPGVPFHGKWVLPRTSLHALAHTKHAPAPRRPLHRLGAAQSSTSAPTSGS